MDNTDAVLIAGGDGTVMEAVTGNRKLFWRPLQVIGRNIGGSYK